MITPIHSIDCILTFDLLARALRTAAPYVNLASLLTPPFPSVYESPTISPVRFRVWPPLDSGSKTFTYCQRLPVMQIPFTEICGLQTRMERKGEFVEDINFEGNPIWVAEYK